MNPKWIIIGAIATVAVITLIVLSFFLISSESDMQLDCTFKLVNQRSV